MKNNHIYFTISYYIMFNKTTHHDELVRVNLKNSLVDQAPDRIWNDSAEGWKGRSSVHNEKHLKSYTAEKYVLNNKTSQWTIHLVQL